MKRALALLLAGVMGLSGLAVAPSGVRAAAKDKGKGAELAIPADAQWSIACQVFTGATRMTDAKRSKDFWSDRTGLPGFYVVHEAQQSTLYYGYYRSIDPTDRKSDGMQARSDRQRMDALQSPNGDRPFRGCVFMPLVTQDPPAPPEWNLANSKGYWSLQIGVFMDSPLRKQAAVDSVKKAREMGIEAYFYHGKDKSMVCIGSWPRAAVKEQEAASAASADPNQPILVSPEPLTNQTIYKKSTGQKIKQMAPKVEILDPTLTDAMKKYPEQLVNGEEVFNKSKDEMGREVKVPISSYLVLVPQKQADPDAPPVPPALAGEGSGDGQQPLPSAFQPPEPPKKGGAGKLKGLGQ